jgi:hypothetical protein
MHHHEPNRWKGFVLGAAGSVLGFTAMRFYRQAVTALTGKDPLIETTHSKSGALDSISLVGQHHKEGEPSTAAAGRILYRLTTGYTPQSPETRALLSHLAHWSYGMLISGVYGAMRGTTAIPDLRGGFAFGTALWIIDELGTPLLGLAKGPTAYSLRRHVHGWGIHLVYGMANSTTTQVLHRLV